MTVCLWVCVHTSVYVCVWVTLSTVRIMYACVPKYEYVNPFLWPFSHILLHESSIYACTHTHTSPFLSTLKCGQGVKWQVFNQCWPPHAMVLICWTCLNPQRYPPPPFHLIHPLTESGCHTQVAVFCDSLTNNMWGVKGRRRMKNGDLCWRKFTEFKKTYLLRGG